MSSRVPSPASEFRPRRRTRGTFIDSSIRARHQGGEGTRVPLRWDTARMPSRWPASMSRCPPRPRAHTSPWSTPDFLTAPTNGDLLLPHQCESDACGSANLIDRLLGEWARPSTILSTAIGLCPRPFPVLLVRFVFCTDSPLLSPTYLGTLVLVYCPALPACLSSTFSLPLPLARPPASLSSSVQPCYFSYPILDILFDPRIP